MKRRRSIPEALMQLLNYTDRKTRVNANGGDEFMRYSQRERDSVDVVVDGCFSSKRIKKCFPRPRARPRSRLRVLTFEPFWQYAVPCVRETAAKRLRSKDRVGRAFCGLSWEGCNDAINSERVAPAINPFSVGSLYILFPP